MTIWYVRNRLDQPQATIANQKRNKSLSLSSSSSSSSSSAVESFTRQAAPAVTVTEAATKTAAAAVAGTVIAAGHQTWNVKWLRMHVIALKLSHCWRLILYAIIMSVISQAPPYVNANNGAAFGLSPSKMLPTAAAASTWPSNFFDADRIQCPSFVDNSACPCYKFEDGKF